MCRSSVAMTGLNIAGIIHITITTLKKTTAKMGEMRNPAMTRSG